MNTTELELIKAGLIALECLCNRPVSRDDMDYLTETVSRIKVQDANTLAASTQQLQ